MDILEVPGYNVAKRKKPSSYDLEGKVILLTNGASTLGAELAVVALSNAGRVVIGLDSCDSHDNLEDLKKLQERVEPFNFSLDGKRSISVHSENYCEEGLHELLYNGAYRMFGWFDAAVHELKLPSEIPYKELTRGMDFLLQQTVSRAALHFTEFPESMLRARKLAHPSSSQRKHIVLVTPPVDPRVAEQYRFIVPPVVELFYIAKDRYEPKGISFSHFTNPYAPLQHNPELRQVYDKKLALEIKQNILVALNPRQSPRS